MARRWPLGLGIIVGLFAVSLALWSVGALAAQWGHAARWIARIALPIFLVTYLASWLGRL